MKALAEPFPTKWGSIPNTEVKTILIPAGRIISHEIRFKP